VSRRSTRLLVVVGLALAVGLATAVSPFASPSPDGLERVAQDQGFVDRGAPHALQEGSPAPGYAVPGIADERLATGVAGFAGTLGVFALSYGLAVVLRRRRGDAPARGRGAAA
jgi:hypothetical protein